MNLDFISEALKDVCNVEIVEYDGYERAAITAKGFEEVIEVHYFPDGYYKYTVNFASWHMETSSREDLLDSVLAFVDGEYAAIEFFGEGVACFGGAVEIDIAEDISYEALREMFAEDEDITKLTFSVRSWNRYCCYDGIFVKHAETGYTVFRIYKGTADC